MKSALILLLGLVAAVLVSPGSALGNDDEAVVEVAIVDGSILRGRLLWHRGPRLAIYNESLGRIELRHDQIRTINGRAPQEFRPMAGDRRADFEMDPDKNTLLLSPTPETLGQGSLYFRSFELFFLNFGGGLTDDLDFSIGFLFPVSSNASMVALGFKYRLISRSEFPVGLAVTVGGMGVTNETKFASAALVAGIGNHRQSLNLSLHQGYKEFENPVNMFIVGGDWQFISSAKLIAEYANGLAPLFGGDDPDDIDGFLNVGFRLFGAKSSFSLTGIRPLGTDTDGFIAFPLAMYSRHF